MTFKATHTVTTTDAAGRRERYCVMEFEGGLYTRFQWADGCAPTWSIADGHVAPEGWSPAVGQTWTVRRLRMGGQR